MFLSEYSSDEESSKCVPKDRILFPVYTDRGSWNPSRAYGREQQQQQQQPQQQQMQQMPQMPEVKRRIPSRPTNGNSNQKQYSRRRHVHVKPAKKVIETMGILGKIEKDGSHAFTVVIPKGVNVGRVTIVSADEHMMRTFTPETKGFKGRNGRYKTYVPKFMPMTPGFDKYVDSAFQYKPRAPGKLAKAYRARPPLEPDHR
jgi:hypothetical protein